MRKIMLYLFIYSFVLLFMARPIDSSMSNDPFYALMLIGLWVVISSAIVHIIHFWPSNNR